MPLGLMPGMGYEEKEIMLEKGESVLFYSKGLVEAHDPKGEMFGFPRPRALVAEHGEQRPLGYSLLDELYSFVGEGWEQGDDITLLTLERSATRSCTVGEFIIWSVCRPHGRGRGRGPPAYRLR